ncbi:50S ribosomal protein L23 [Halomicronema hongdechloris C2206]|uniref:Large ribosomal subunit protein uL23 n=1 Tax=Halomicronema hongdechloris C2206 TaxID=1641165 RepID=A0A1Z3HVL6_9CYAN|nr:50S ribosomal protein L23 [Halomicronema hongdechloris]ASC74315.1 50S ribosomal protein L23 [Halomicronema hongdechloris C2206]
MTNPQTLADIVRRPIVTEKATLLLENNQYTFEVAPNATKPDIKAAIEELFDVKVVGVSTSNPPRKKRRFGRFLGYKPSYKRAMVTLAPGDTITLFPDV